MKKEPKIKDAILIKKDSRLYDLKEGKWVIVKEDVTINDWDNHIEHIRLSLNGKRFSFPLEKGTYKWIYRNEK